MSYKKFVIVLLRVSLGWLLLYAGWQKVVSHPAFSAEGFLTHAATFPGFYKLFAMHGILTLVNILNSWGQVAIGVGLVLGAWTRWAARAGALLMILYYFPGLDFPHILADTHAYIVDEHIIYALGFLTLDALRAGRYLGVDGLFRKTTA